MCGLLFFKVDQALQKLVQELAFTVQGLRSLTPALESQEAFTGLCKASEFMGLMQDFVHQQYEVNLKTSGNGVAYSWNKLSRFLSNPFILRVPFFLIFSFNKGTLNQKGQKGTTHGTSF